LFVLYHALIRVIKSRLINFAGHSNCRTKTDGLFTIPEQKALFALSENGSLFSTA